MMTFSARRSERGKDANAKFAFGVLMKLDLLLIDPLHEQSKCLIYFLQLVGLCSAFDKSAVKSSFKDWRIVVDGFFVHKVPGFVGSNEVGDHVLETASTLVSTCTHLIGENKLPKNQ